jgi:hypothetical protein
MLRRTILATMLAAGAMASAAGQTSVPPAPADEPAAAEFYYAGAAGRLTTDRDRLGGSPFASALVEVLQRPISHQDFGPQLAAANAVYSFGWHQAQAPRIVRQPRWRMQGAADGKRVALVLINWDYSASGVDSLRGAQFDAQRVPAALQAAGYETRVVVNADNAGAKQALAAFAERSASAEAALIYVGGHGVQHRRTVYWMMGDYPEQDEKWLPTHAIALDEIGRAARARDVNMILYASCRDDPFSGR